MVQLIQPTLYSDGDFSFKLKGWKHEIADRKAKQADQEDRISFLEIDRMLMKKEIEKLKESIAREDDSDEENDAIIIKENMRRKEIKKNKGLVRSPSNEYLKQKSFKDILAQDLKAMADEPFKKAKRKEEMTFNINRNAEKPI